MRKIEQDMIRAVTSERSRMTSGNTAVIREGNALTVYLHGNCIARKMTDGTWKFNLCGWNTHTTHTTRSRINALAEAFGCERVFNRNGKPLRLDGLGRGDRRNFVEVPLNDWF